jgi:GT2 family glycosyltransferase
MIGPEAPANAFPARFQGLHGNGYRRTERVTVSHVAPALVDVVVVSYNSAETLGDCLAPFVPDEDFHPVVVDNASADRSVEVASGLGVQVLALTTNYGFAHGCNRGWESGSAPYVLFLNPDARITPESVRRLVDVLEANEATGLVAPRISAPDGALELSIRRFPRFRSTFSRALFLHRVAPHASWSDEDVWDPAEYKRPHRVDWVSGACMLVRRTALEQLAGWDESYFHYGEDVDLCRRLWVAGYQVVFEPAATAVHIGGVSSPRPRLRPILVRSRVLYARKHRGPILSRLDHVAIGTEELTHALFTLKGGEVRAGHMQALRTLLRGIPDASQSPSQGSDPSGIEADARGQ